MPIRTLMCAAFTSAVMAGAPDEKEQLAVGDRGEAVTEVVREAEKAGFSGVVLVADAGEVIAVVSTGSGDDALTPDTLFEIASVTKQFTAAAVLMLGEEGRLDLDDPISAHLPGVPDSCAGITVRHLLQHTSGIPGTNSRGGGEDLATVMPVFLRGGPKHEPGTHWGYWNQGYSLLSAIIERASGQPYTAYSRAHVFEPAGLEHTLFTGDEAPDDVPVATGASQFGPARTALEHPYGDSYGYQYRGMGGVVTNVWDLHRWDRALDAHDLLSEPSTETFFAPGLNDYALGWFVEVTPMGTLQRHGGRVRGFGADLRRYPERDGLIVVLCNNDSYRVPDLAQRLEIAAYWDLPEDQGGATLDSVRPLFGTYRGPQGTKLIIERTHNPNYARATISWGERFPNTNAVIERAADGTLMFDDQYTRSPVRPTVVDGEVTAITIGGGELEMEFEREE